MKASYEKLRKENPERGEDLENLRKKCQEEINKVKNALRMNKGKLTWNVANEIKGQLEVLGKNLTASPQSIYRSHRSR